MSNPRPYWGQKTLCVVTGASQGIGQQISTDFANNFNPDSLLVLIARSSDGLNETKKLIEASSPTIKVEIVPFDLSKPDVNEFTSILGKLVKDSYDLNILVHNAGSEGSTKHAVDFTDLQEWQSYMALNLYSVTMLTSAWLKVVKSGKKSIINITSKAAIEPFKSMGLYCIGKASREMYFRTLALEDPTLDVLNYSPGPVKTDMIDRVIEKVENPETKGAFVSMKDNNQLVLRQDTISILISILAKGAYKTGQRVDYFETQDYV